MAGREGPPLGSRVTAGLIALALGAACLPLALFALWPPPPGTEPGLHELLLPEVPLLGAAGVGAATALRWALGLHGRWQVLLGWLLGLAPCLVVTIELLRRTGG